MLASFVITFHTRRLDNLFQTIRFLNYWHKATIQQCELLLICQDQCGPIESGFKETKLFNMKLKEMSLPIQINKGVKEAKSNLIVLLESDRILAEGYFQEVFDTIQPKEIVTTNKMWRISKMVSDEDIILHHYPSYEECRSQTNELLTRNTFSGNTIFWKEDFSGADEAYIGYGWLDHDLTSSMEAKGIRTVWRDDLELHLWHEFMTYGEKDQKRLFVQNAIRYCKKWNKPYPKEIIKEMQNYSRGMI